MNDLSIINIIDAHRMTRPGLEPGIFPDKFRVSGIHFSKCIFGFRVSPFHEKGKGKGEGEGNNEYKKKKHRTRIRKRESNRKYGK